jgi:aldose 1-epimerase
MRQRYSVNSVVRDGVEVFLLEEGRQARAAVAPELGMNCFSFETRVPILEDLDYREFRKKPTSYGIPLLFPFPNRVRDGAFTFRRDRFKVNPPRHGLVRDKAFRVIETGATSSEGAWVRGAIKASDYPQDILGQFPFPFTLEVTYRVRAGELELDVVAANTGDRVMPVGFGIHPYFRRPARGSIQVPASRRWELKDSLPTGRILDVDPLHDLRAPRDLETIELDDVYTDAAADESGRVSCLLNDDVNRIQTVVEFERRQLPHIVVYTPPAPRPALCIEPQSCPTDAFNLHAQGVAADVIELEPGRRTDFLIRIRSRDL